MPENKENISVPTNSPPSGELEEAIRSDEVQEILSAVPNWMIRWGITLIFGLIVMLVFISWFIKYPDVIEGQAIITTTEPPAKLVSKSSGYLEQLYFKDNSSIKKGDIIAEITNPTNKESILFLDSLISKFPVNQIKNNSISFVLTQLANKNLLLGNELPEFNQFIQNLTELNVLLTDQFYQNTIQNFNQQIDYNGRLALITNEQLNLLNQEIKNANEKFKADSILYQKGYTAKHEFFKNQSELISKKQELANLKKTYVNYQITVTNYAKQKDEATQQFELQKRTLNTNISANIKSIKNYINTWQQNYTFTSPINGKLTYLSNLTENQFINSSTTLFAVVPDNQNYIGQITIPTQGFGKVTKGQKVRIKLNNYPYQEFGQLIGEITDISLIPTAISETQNAYFITISLPQDLITTYKKEITFTPEMTGTAEIITEDLRLIERIFNMFRKVLDK
jgi:HlyD family type I secretion membrane fusion protein